MKRITVFIILNILLAFQLVQADAFLQGTIGETQIGMAFWDQEQAYGSSTKPVNGMYFKTASLCDVDITGFFTENKYLLYTNYSNTGYDEKFELTQVSDKEFKGTWTSSGKTLPVSLKAIDVSKIETSFKKVLNGDDNYFDYMKSDFYNYYKSSFLKFKKQGSKKINWLVVDNYSEEHCKSNTFFRISSGFEKNKLERINDYLFMLHMESVLRDFSMGECCIGHKTELNIDYTDENLLSVNCRLLDLNNLVEYKLTDLLAFDTSGVKPFDASEGKQEIFYLITYFGPGLLDLVKKYSIIKGGPDPDGENRVYDPCVPSYPEFWENPSWKFTRKGIYFIRDSDCAQPLSIFIPFKVLKPYRNPNFPYPFPE